MNTLIKILSKSGLFKDDVDYHLVRASMVLVFVLFGYQKWFEYEAQTLIPFISNGPLIFWLYPVFGTRGASWFLGASEWLFAALLFWGFWNKRAGILGALGCMFAMIGTVTIIPFMPDGWDAAAGFPAMKGNVAFLMKDFVLLSVSVYLLKQDALRVSAAAAEQRDRREVVPRRVPAAEAVKVRLHAVRGESPFAKIRNRRVLGHATDVRGNCTTFLRIPAISLRPSLCRTFDPRRSRTERMMPRFVLALLCAALVALVGLGISGCSSSDSGSGGKMESKKMSSDKMSSDKMGSDKMSSDKMGSNTMESSKMGTDKMGDGK